VKGLKKSILLFERAKKDLLAYKTFLKRSKFNLNESVESYDAFTRVPQTTKKNYIVRYRRDTQVWPGETPPMIHASSGSSGRATFWPRNQVQEKRGGVLHRRLFEHGFELDPDTPTLAIVCFSMGVWIAGVYTMFACREAAESGMELSTITPGIDQEEILSILKQVAPDYPQVILAGYSPFILEVLHEARKRGIPLASSENRKIKILTAGDSITESWRTNVCKLLRTNNVLHTVVNIYGSADAGIIGYETPATIYVRRQSMKDDSLRSALFGSAEKTPALFQYDPGTTFLESVDGELVITSNISLPLIRYNIHDVGNTFTHSWVSKMLQDTRHSAEFKKLSVNWPEPFVTVHGRTDVAVTFYALNILPEHINAVLQRPSVAKLVKANFRASTRDSVSNGQQELHIVFELRVKKVSPRERAFISQAVFETLREKNIEYAKLYDTIGDRAKPRIHMLTRVVETPDLTDALLQMVGKKPKVILKK
jgi:phenylacetate-CoA ligase